MPLTAEERQFARQTTPDMAYFFTFLFLATAYVTPDVLFGPLGPYHLEIVFAAFAILASIPSLESAGLLKLPQTYAALGVCFAAVVSIAAGGWLGGIPQICYSLLPVVAGFFLAAVNCRKKWHFVLIVVAMFLGSAYFILRGAIDLHAGNLVSPFLYSKDVVPRLRGLGTVNDPNDLSQVMVSLIPLTFLWRSKSRIANVFLIGIPVAILLCGLYLSHSRGASIALMIMIVLSLRKKIGTVPAVVLAGSLFLAVLAVGWGGGRDVSIDTGEGRLGAWSEGLQYVKAHPLVGIGYSQFGDVYGITAHNSVVVCVAEIGVPGFLCWVLFLFSTFRFTLRLGAAPKELAQPDQQAGESPPIVSASQLWAAKRAAAAPGLLQLETGLQAPAAAGWSRAVILDRETTTLPPEELRRIAQLMTISLTGYLAAGWFLSRAFNIWLFVYCGMACAVVRMAAESGVQIPTDRPGFLLRWSACIGVILLLAVYIILRIHNVVG